MDNKITKVLIGDDSAEYGISYANELRRQGFYAVTRHKDGKVILNAIQNDKPDVVIMDANLPSIDAIEVLERSQILEKIPVFIVTSIHEDEFIQRQVMEKGASYFMLRPFDVSVLKKRIEALIAEAAQRKKYIDRKKLEIIVTDMIRQLGVPAHVKGYHYLRAAILVSVDDYTLLESVTTRLYPTVAEQFHTTASRVERAIRHAIGIAWNQGNPEAFNALFGYTVNSRRKKPANSELIALLTDKIRLQFGKGDEQNKD